MSFDIERAAIIGAGWMGSSLAALLASAGIEILLIDMLPPAEPSNEDLQNGISRNSLQWRNRTAEQAVDDAFARGAFIDPYSRRRVTCGNLVDDRHLIEDCDWVLEAVPEVLEVKRATYDKVGPHIRPDAVISSITSTIQAERLVQGRSDSFANRFMITHFFNPVRRTRLLELVPCHQTDGNLLDKMQDFGAHALGKGVLIARDTPGFIANRIGLFGLATAMQKAEERGMSVVTCDLLTGQALTRASSGTYRTIDYLGVDSFNAFLESMYAMLPEDAWRDHFKPSDRLRDLLRQRYLGHKVGHGFYQHPADNDSPGRLALAHGSMEYVPQKPDFYPSVTKALADEDMGRRLRKLMAGDDEGARYAWELLRDTLAYSASLLGEISDYPIVIDRALRWGYNWNLGPFEIWDALGVAQIAERMAKDGLEIPEQVTKILEKDQSFYSMKGGQRRQVYLEKKEQVTVHMPAGEIRLSEIRSSSGDIAEDYGTLLYDLGNGVGCLDLILPNGEPPYYGDKFVSAMMRMYEKVISLGLRGLVLGSSSGQFPSRLELRWLLGEAKAQNWETIEKSLVFRQKFNSTIRSSPFPVVAAISGNVRSGGLELAMHCGRVQAHADTTLGLTETQLGLIPVGGGCKEMLYRALERVQINGPHPLAQYAFDHIFHAQRAKGAFEARRMGFLRRGDNISMGLDRVLADSKQLVLELISSGYRPPPVYPMNLPGPGGAIVISQQLKEMHWKGRINEHDVQVGLNLAKVVTGGEVSSADRIGQEPLLELEREGFLSLLGTEETQHRLEQAINRS